MTRLSYESLKETAADVRQNLREAGLGTSVHVSKMADGYVVSVYEVDKRDPAHGMHTGQLSAREAKAALEVLHHAILPAAIRGLDRDIAALEEATA